MPRKAFVADLAKAVEGVAIAGISNVKPSGDDGEFTFDCATHGVQVRISALIPDVSEYPESHSYMLFTGEDAPASVTDKVAKISDSSAGVTVTQLLQLVSRRLGAVDSDGDHEMMDSQEFSDEEAEEEEEEEEEEEDYFSDGPVMPQKITASNPNASDSKAHPRSTASFRQRIRSDLRIAKAHGFKIGHHGGLLDGHNSYVSISCRVAKLGISGEAMKAWDLLPSEYVILVYYYPVGYKSMDFLTCDATTARRYVDMRVGVSSTYKPTKQEALRMFTTVASENRTHQWLQKSQEEPAHDATRSDEKVRKGFRDAFISKPLNGLLNDRLLHLLVLRYNGMPWSGAEAYFNDYIGTKRTNSDGYEDKYHEQEQVERIYPSIVTSDHIQDPKYHVHSFPLVGMQFVLRHLVRCTEFCLVCFTKMPEGLQAIKPYVCDKPLCLYQYMSLGFGPSIEHEVLTQPKVVDLLISFCYASARADSLKDFPIGLGFMVPPMEAFEKDYPDYSYHYPGAPYQVQSVPSGTETKESVGYNITVNYLKREMLFPEDSTGCPLRNGDWVAIRTHNDNNVAHCRVVDATYYPIINLSERVLPYVSASSSANQSAVGHAYPAVPNPAAASTGVEPAKDEFIPGEVFVYNVNFDNLKPPEKKKAICAMLDVLPRVTEMKDYLRKNARSLLRTWINRLPPAALGILRWIIASNRACIMQVEDDNDRVHDMSGWAQFHFAMGAPDKERRFQQAVQETTRRLNLKYPTRFAWHGSPFHNWHSIIREGLHFEKTVHGRAYGNGVYHSPYLSTSLGYSNSTGGGVGWSGSEFSVMQAIALNEIVNAPCEYVCSNPHLVVAQLDWIQTRYLFVSEVPVVKPRDPKPKNIIEQDPLLPAESHNRQPLLIPDTSLRKQHAEDGRLKHQDSKRRKMGTGNSASDPINLDDDDDGGSEATLEEDRNIFLSDDEELLVHPSAAPASTSVSGQTSTSASRSAPSMARGKLKAGALISTIKSKVSGKSDKQPPKTPLTDFEPGKLDYKTLPMLAQPTWATTSTTKRLMKDFDSLLKVQEKGPLHELGWYIDPDKFENMYQWIVELHSFDPDLPLARDMKAKGHKSIVLELRFGHQYPISPPFVRVIRPRFLGFQEGGGGHVTLGGAMCMQLLTNDGWSPVSSIESVLIQVRMAISSTDPRPARLAPGDRSDYGIGEAVEAFKRACKIHGWKIPEGFEELTLGQAGALN
ncbi:uncharacterized protein EI97DRAFT_319244 [Westerdykella ornata]|uniref:UBC core domain-containing protein n=1 Tax=Westerdykella ornata TaxID=318751 RepID=A0A6A6JKF7_WESOR|nr:uncharacterized protein EI97DRAFT_319244 [Westerdykella ornata]KAF2276715.1 hypothetical protein EI97DRAFT_319244 [Westerdykella ornata]